MPAVGGIRLEGIHWWVKISRILNLLHLDLSFFHNSENIYVVLC